MKMRSTVIHAAVIALALATLPAIADETTTTTTTTVKKHHYVYYGDHDIYFAPETKTYYWREGTDWRSGNELPAESRAYISTGGVNVDLDTERPYEKNEWVVEHYKKHDH
jgi:hypothetical protein